MTNSAAIDYELVYADLKVKLTTIATTSDPAIFSGLWTYLEDSEQKLIQLMAGGHPPDNTEGNIEFGPTLYLMNNDLPSYITDVLRDLGMPQSSISTTLWNSWKVVVEQGPGVIASDGTLISNIPFAQLDKGWALAAAFYVYYYYAKDTKATFGTNPATVNINNQTTLTIAVMGDWGTGSWQDGQYVSPSVAVGKAISSLKPNITLHLGDVYYSGLWPEEQMHLLQTFPAGSQYNFTLNSNHEMYDGGNGYFGTALTNGLFAVQNKTSYFVINFADWVLVALDSAYYDDSFFVMQGALDPGQQSFVQGLNIGTDKKVIVFTHHTALATDGSAINNASDMSNLFADVYFALNERYPDFWYYGHTHNGIVYNDNSVTKNYKTAFNRHPKIRCIGHGAIPFGNGYDLYDSSGKPIAAVDYYAHTPLPKPDVQQQKRVLNGFAMLTLQKGTLTEDVYEVSPVGTMQRVWTKTHNF